MKRVCRKSELHVITELSVHTTGFRSVDQETFVERLWGSEIDSAPYVKVFQQLFVSYPVFTHTFTH